MTSGISGEGAWIAKGLGWFMGMLFGLAFRLEVAIFMIPIQAIVGLCQPKKTSDEIAIRSIFIGIFAAAAGLGVYELKENAKPQPVFPPQASAGPTPSLPPTHVSKKSRKKSSGRPSFDCTKARTPVELLICRDGGLADLESNMASAYRQALSRVPQDRRRELAQAHLAWFKNYSRTCNRAASDQDRATCIANFLTARTADLNRQ